MARRSSRVKRVRSVRDRKFGRRKPPRSNWPIIGGIAAGVLVVAAIITLVVVFRGREVAPEDTLTPTSPAEGGGGETPVDAATATPAPTSTPSPTLVPTATPEPTSTPVPQSCEVQEDAWVRGEPTEQSTGITQVAAGDEVLVIGEVAGESGEVWYQLTGYQAEAYIRVAVVNCSTP